MKNIDDFLSLLLNNEIIQDKALANFRNGNDSNFKIN